MNTQPNNVIPIRSNFAVFPPDLRGSIEAGIKSYTDKPTEAVNEIEQIISVHLVALVRRGASKFATLIGEYLFHE